MEGECKQDVMCDSILQSANELPTVRFFTFEVMTMAITLTTIARNTLTMAGSELELRKDMAFQSCGRKSLRGITSRTNLQNIMSRLLFHLC